MNNRSFSEEEMRQREKEERSRLRKQEQAYREAQRGVYSRIYQEQDAMPEDYRAAFWEDPRDRLYDQDRRAAQKGDDWEAERRQIQEELGLDPRVTILGHIQRGGSPTAKDRVMATRMGYEAVHLLAAGKTNRVVCARGDSIVDVDINDGLAMHKTLNSEEYEVMEAMTGI